MRCIKPLDLPSCIKSLDPYSAGFDRVFNPKSVSKRLQSYWSATNQLSRAPIVATFHYRTDLTRKSIFSLGFEMHKIPTEHDLLACQTETTFKTVAMIQNRTNDRKTLITWNLHFRVDSVRIQMHKIPTEHIFNRFQIQTNFIKAIRGDLPSEPLRVRDEGGPSRELDSSWIRNKRSIYFHSSVTLRARFQTYCIQFTLYARSLGSTARQSSSSSNLTQAAPEQNSFLEEMHH